MRPHSLAISRQIVVLLTNSEYWPVTVTDFPHTSIGQYSLPLAIWQRTCPIVRYRTKQVPND